jgi:hypothetical protein
VYPRICEIRGHFIVVDCVDVEYIYFRDPRTATARRVSFESVLAAENELLSTTLNFSLLEGAALKEHADRFYS